MTYKHQNKYRAQSHRMPSWDYSAVGLYFITMVTQNRESYLGRVENGNVLLSDWGKTVREEWLKSFEIRTELFCDEYVIMPNHLHAILIIDHPEDTGIDTHGRAYQQYRDQYKNQLQNPQQPEFFRQPRSISSFIAGFKSAVNSKIDDYIDEHQLAIPKFNRSNHFFQPNYHDRIIRNDGEYRRIKRYIKNNPKDWKEDGLPL